MSDQIKAALIVAAAIVVPAAMYIYFSHDDRNASTIPFPPMFSSGSDRTYDTPHQVIQHEVDRENAMKEYQ